MRILIDLHGIRWRDAWATTQATFSYTNHTLLPEALETWPVPLMERLLPRHMQIIYLINANHLAQMSKLPDANGERLSAFSLIDEARGRRVRMGHLAFLGSHKVNGVSKLHSDLMKVTVFRELDFVLPGRITNKTNGITFRRWLKQANPGLTTLLTEVVGDRILDDAMALENAAAVAGDTSFQERYAAQRRANKVALSKLVRQRLGVVLDPDALFDVQIKRIHEYKRQVLNILEAVAVYDAIRAQPMRDWIPRVKIFAGKAAASYSTAKLIIRLANDVAEIVNSDPTVRGLLKIVFLPNYNVSLAERIIPAADVSEQISTAGMEASGTGNMKLALNGALTIGTLDGANVEIRERVGGENVFIFGLTAEEVEARRQQGIDGRPAIERSVKLAEVLDAIGSGVFSPDEPDRYRGLVDMLTHNDYFMVTADFDSYFEAQRSVFRRWRDKHAWWQAAALNTAHMGWFSSDRTISEYAKEIWDVPAPAARKGINGLHRAGRRWRQAIRREPNASSRDRWSPAITASATSAANQVGWVAAFRSEPTRSASQCCERMLDSSSSPSANASSSKILCRLTSAQKSPINTGLRTQTSGLRRTGGDPKFSLSGRFSPNLRTLRI